MIVREGPATRPRDGTVRRVARPRGVIPDAERKALEAASAAYHAAVRQKDEAEAALRQAADAAFVAGGSHEEIRLVAKIARSTVQKYVTSRRDG